ncbi:hypothetical protein [Lactobacillus equicursoris]|uniref:hypothetical protein n=1 Tax=Lactobacillus equicursoris TaxID=420645 RepID=UPI0024321DA9|nr:hypothetical protein [Lactobacillus equicursoris]
MTNKELIFNRLNDEDAFSLNVSFFFKSKLIKQKLLEFLAKKGPSKVVFCIIKIRYSALTAELFCLENVGDKYEQKTIWSYIHIIISSKIIYR